DEVGIQNQNVTSSQTCATPLPSPIKHKQFYGITFEQGRNALEINAATMLSNFVTENKTVTEEQKRDLVISLITLKYTQSNSVCRSIKRRVGKDDGDQCTMQHDI